MGAIVWPVLSSLSVGIGSGALLFAGQTTVQKIAMLYAQLDVQPNIDPDEGPEILPSEVIDKQFVPGVVIAPIVEEVVFRGIMQPLLSVGISYCFPQLSTSAFLSISKASLLSATMTAAAFGMCHYPDYKKGAPFAVAMSTIAGSVFGVVRERFGILASISAHMMSNLSTGLLDKHWPELLEFPKERELRLLPPREKELQLLQMAVKRVDEAIVDMPQNDERANLENLRLEWIKQTELLKHC